MQLNLVINTNDAETVFNAFRLANTGLEDGHDVEAFLLGDGVEAADIEHEKVNPRGVLRKFLNEGGELAACGTCMDSRDLEPGELRPRATMTDLLDLVEAGDRVLTFG